MKPETLEPETPPPDHRHHAHGLANEGRFAEALIACDKAIETGKLDPVCHYLRGIILMEQEALEDATAALRRALYLDPNFVLAHFALGNLMRQRSRAGDAERSFANARSLLRDYDRDAVLPESDGITAGRLLHILSSMMEANA